MPKRGINVKPILVTIDRETWTLLQKYKGWGTPVSAHIRRCVKSYEKKQPQNNHEDWDGVDEL